MRNFQLIRQIARHHDVTLLTYEEPYDEPHIAEMAGTMSIEVVRRKPKSRAAKRVAQLVSLGSRLPFACISVRTREMQDAIDRLTSRDHFDLLHVESSTMSFFRFPAGVPMVIDEHNIEYELFERLYRGEHGVLRRQFNGVEYRRMRRFEQASWQHAQACAVTSERDEPIISAVAPATPTAVVPNGVDLDYFAPTDVEPAPRTVVFVGVLNYRPNVDAAHHLVHEVWPLVIGRFPDAELRLVGPADEREASGLRAPGVQVVGGVPDVRPYLHSASVVAVPVRMGSGTRLKVVEALSLGKAMVSTTLGCEGIAANDREHLLIADDAQTFADRIAELFENPQLREQLGKSGRALAEERYSWNVAGDRLEALYARVVPQAPSATGPTSASAEHAGT